MRFHGPVIGLIVLACLAACRGTDGNNIAAAGNARAVPALVRGCPFPNRGWSVRLQPAATLPAQVVVSGEVFPDSSGRDPSNEWGFRVQQPPILVLELESQPQAEPHINSTATQSQYYATQSQYYFPDNPAYTHVEVRCEGVEIARLPIVRPR